MYGTSYRYITSCTKAYRSPTNCDGLDAAACQYLKLQCPVLASDASDFAFARRQEAYTEFEFEFEIQDSPSHAIDATSQSHSYIRTAGYDDNVVAIATIASSLFDEPIMSIGSLRATSPWLSE